MKNALFRTLFAAALAVFACGAGAQQYKWVDKDGRTQYGDTPPPGVKATPLKAPTGPAPAPAASGKDAAKDAKSNKPLTPAEQDAEYRKRQMEAEKARQKDEKAAADLAAKKDNCARAQETLRAYESGQRVARVDAQGERYFLDDNQLASEAAKARSLVQQWCN